jgi:hypothetical protein
MASKPRPFNPDYLTPHVVAAMRPQIGTGAAFVRKYTVLVPVAQARTDGTKRTVATDEGLVALELMLTDHFGGLTVPAVVPILRGLGARNPQELEQSREINVHTYFLVYAAVHEAADHYFLALNRELEEALDEGVILIERQEVTIL